MIEEQRAAAVFAQAVYVMGEIESMKAINAERDRHNLAQAYGEQAFIDAIGKIRGDIVNAFLVGNLDGLP